jgi:hypothetical protein
VDEDLRDPAAPGPAADLDRLTACTYLTVPDRATHLAIMRVFTSTLLAGLSAHDVAERLGGALTADGIAGKLGQPAAQQWGDVIRVVIDVAPPTSPRLCSPRRNGGTTATSRRSAATSKTSAAVLRAGGPA